MIIVYNCIGFRLTKYFFFIFVEMKKISEFLPTIFEPKLYVIINNYWRKHNIDKIPSSEKH